MSILALFDIDGTLIRCGGAPRGAIMTAMKDVFGVWNDNKEYSFSGKTDPQIITELMQAAGVEDGKIRQGMQPVIQRYLDQLDKSLRKEDVRVLNGVWPLLSALRTHPHVQLGLLTGNVEEGARIKLMRAGLDHFFFNGDGIGAFGSDAMDRRELPAIAVGRAKEVLHREFRPKDIVVIGDSPSDILCGRHLGVKSVAVATGWHTMEELKQFDPDHIFQTFEPVERVVEAIAC